MNDESSVFSRIQGFFVAGYQGLFARLQFNTALTHSTKHKTAQKAHQAEFKVWRLPCKPKINPATTL